MRVVVGIGFAVAVAAAAWGILRKDDVPGLPNDLAEAWQAVAAAPKDTNAWVRLAEIQQALDQPAGAERSLNTAIELGDASGHAHGVLGFLLYAQGRDLDALAALEEAAALKADLPLLEKTLRELRSLERKASSSVDASPKPVLPDAGPAPLEDAGDPPDAGDAWQADAGSLVADPPEPEPRSPSCRVQLQRGASGSSFQMPVEIEGLEAQLIVDTGASLTLITRGLAYDLNLDLDEDNVIQAITANGRVRMPTAVLSYVEVAGYYVEELRVAVCDGCVESIADGLLGLDLQTMLEMRIDPAAGLAELGPCDSPKP